MDFAHKIIRPDTYDCNLCALTYGVFTEKKQWSIFRKNLLAKDYELSFLYKDEFQKTYKSKFGHSFSFPVILLETAYDLEVLIAADQLNEIETIEELIVTVESLANSL